MNQRTLLLCLLMVAGCTAPIAQRSVLLEPAVLNTQSQPTVALVNPTGDLSGIISPGDKLVGIGPHHVATYQELGELLTDSDVFGMQATLVNSSGATVTVPMESIFLGSDGVSQAAWMEPGATTAASPFQNPDGASQVSGGILAGQLFAAVAGRLWLTTPRLLEVQLSVSTNPECSNCGLADIATLDLPHNSWVQPVAMEQAAWTVLPDLGAPGQMVAAPPPTPAGGTAFANTSGQFNAYSYGNNTTGNYSANTTTSYVPRYDYTATNAAQFNNVGVALRNQRINNQNTARYEFVAKRSGNLRLGPLAPGENVVGHIFFALPAGFEGPFGVQVTNSSGEISWLRLNLPTE